MAGIIFHTYGNLGGYLSFSPSSYVKLLLSNYDNEFACLLQRKPYSGDCWQEVPQDIMEIILDRLPLLDRIRLTAVNKSWASIARQKAIDAAPRLPWLMLPQEEPATSGCNKLLRMYDMVEGNIHKLNLPKRLNGAHCCGFSKGWLIMTKEIINIDQQRHRELRGIQVFVFNPVSGAVCRLPSPISIPSYRASAKYFLGLGCKASFVFRKIELSCADISKCTVAVLFHEKTDGCFLAVCRPGDRKWTTVVENKDKIIYCTDILFYKGTLCAWIWSGIEQVKSYTLDLDEGGDHEVMNIKLIPNLTGKQNRLLFEYETLNNEDEFRVIKEAWLSPYLVESSSSNSELLLIIKIADVLSNQKYDRWEYNKISGFEVFKMDADSGELSRLYRLDDQVIFLSYSGSFSVSAKDQVYSQGNCIYFLENLNYDGWVGPVVSRESGVYYLDNGRIERPFPSTHLPSQWGMSWFMLNSICGSGTSV